MTVPKTVFYLDDDSDDHLIFSMAIADFPNVKLIDFYQADDLCKRLDDGNYPLPDIIFLDINLGGTNGIDCLKTIKQKSRTSNLPVIMYSTSQLTPEVEKALSGGLDKYLEKPHSIAELKKVLKPILGE